jgi:hypothetical protein
MARFFLTSRKGISAPAPKSTLFVFHARPVGDCDRITLTRAGGNRGRHNSMKDGHQYLTPDFLTLSMFSNIKELTGLQISLCWVDLSDQRGERAHDDLVHVHVVRCSIAYWMARPMASGWIAILRQAFIRSRAVSSLMVSASSDSTTPG